jgi:uncharacterized protein
MLTILSLFGRSPFAPLQSHMEKVTACVKMVPQLFEALSLEDYEKIDKLAKEISKLEHHADLMKNDIRNNLPKSYYLPIDRSHLLEILALQDRLADTAEDIAILLTLKKLQVPEGLEESLKAVLNKNLESFDGVCRIIHELQELLECSFGGREAEKVRTFVDDVAYKEHEADLLHRELFKKLIGKEDVISYTSYDLWCKIFNAIADISNLSEKLANRVRMTLDIK